MHHKTHSPKLIFHFGQKINYLRNIGTERSRLTFLGCQLRLYCPFNLSKVLEEIKRQLSFATIEGFQLSFLGPPGPLVVALKP